MADEPKTIDMTPSFTEAACMLVAAFESGTPKGRDMARIELMRWAAILDGIKAKKLDPHNTPKEN